MKKLVCIIATLWATTVFAQDPQFSQYYASSTYLNPAFSSVVNNVKAGIQHRDQWREIGNHFTTSMIHGNVFFEKMRSGVGFYVMDNKEGSGDLRRLEIMGNYSFKIPLSEKASIIPGIQAGYMQNSINYNGLDFGDQYTYGGATNATSEQLANDQVNFMDFGAGLLFVSQRLFFGTAVHHISEPENSVIESGDKLKRKFSTHLGYKIPLGEHPVKEKSFILTGMYKSQGRFDQMDLGMYFVLEPVVIGAWYRGLPLIKDYEDVLNNESIVGMAGIKIRKFMVGYSYDYVISGLQGKGVHEVSLSYEFMVKSKPKEPKLGMPIPLF